MMTLFPHVLNSLEVMKIPLQAALAINQVQRQALTASVDLFKNTQDLILRLARRYSVLLPPEYL